MRLPWLSTCVGIAALAASGSAPGAGDGAMTVREVSVKFSRVRPSADGGLRGNARLRGHFAAKQERFDAATDAFCLVLGPCGILRRGDFATTVPGKEDAWGDWTLLAKRPFGKGSRVKVKFSPYSGEISADGKGIDLTALAGRDGDLLSIFLMVGDGTYRAPVVLEPDAGGARWEYEPGTGRYVPPLDYIDGTRFPDMPPLPTPDAPQEEEDWQDIDMADPPRT